MHLFKPLTIGDIHLPNRITMAANASGHARSDGRISAQLVEYYHARGRGGVGMIVVENAYPTAPSAPTQHIAAYSDQYLPGLQACASAIIKSGATPVLMIDQGWSVEFLSSDDLSILPTRWAAAAQRAKSAGFAGVLLSSGANSPFGRLLSPGNARGDQYGGSLQGRARLLLETIEQVRLRTGPRFLIGVQLNIGDHTPSGLPLHDARMVARWLISGSVRLIEVISDSDERSHVARFPGWLVPLAAALKSFIEIPVMVGGLLADAELANQVIAEGSADLVTLGEVLRAEPNWPIHARNVLRNLGSS
jgi:2,4-dienoyl-CoA reductase-like NADH-dependent reductase (Old Yellow Enzyme family)